MYTWLWYHILYAGILKFCGKGASQLHQPPCPTDTYFIKHKRMKVKINFDSIWTQKHFTQHINNFANSSPCWKIWWYYHHHHLTFNICFPYWHTLDCLTGADKSRGCIPFIIPTALQSILSDFVIFTWHWHHHQYFVHDTCTSSFCVAISPVLILPWWKGLLEYCKVPDISVSCHFLCKVLCLEIVFQYFVPYLPRSLLLPWVPSTSNLL